MHRFNLRTLLLIAGFTLLGALSAAGSYWNAHGQRNESVLRLMVWTIFATPFATFLGWLVARRDRGWQAAFWCFLIYFFSIFVAARLERLILGADSAQAAGHSLYFKLVLVLNLVAGWGVALREAQTKGTMQTDPQVFEERS